MINRRYNIIRQLGIGGGGEVFLVEDTLRNHQTVALKVLHGEGKVGADAFHNEVSALLNLRHPNLVRVFDFGTVRHATPSSLERRRFFTMEYIAGVDALQWSQGAKSEVSKEAMLETIMMQALSVLSYIHREGVVHFDIKPQNLVLIGDHGSTTPPLLKLTDFGFSHRQDDTTELSVRGTLEYTAPELLRNESFDARVDLYSLGATFFELLEGHCPYEAASPIELVKKVLNEEPAFSKRESDIGQRLQAVTKQLLQRDPAKRPWSAGQAARSLVEGLVGGKEIYNSYFGRTKSPAFVGRAPELSQIETAIASLASGKPVFTPAMLLYGVEGIGKTTLLHEAAKFAHDHEVPVYEAEATQTDVPFACIKTALQLIANDTFLHSDDGKLLVTRYQEILGFKSEIDSTGWAQEKEKYVELVARFVVDSSRCTPFVVFADNIHLMDGQSVEVLRTIARDVTNANIIVLAAETGDAATMFPVDIIHPIPIRDLAESDVVKMSTSMLGNHKFASNVGANIYQLYGGVPATIIEALHAVEADVPPDAFTDEDAAKNYIADLEKKLPRNTDEFYLARFRRVSTERQLILSLVSCFQYLAPVEAIFRLLPFRKERASDQLRYLTVDGFLVWSDADRCVSLRVKRLKDAIYGSLQNHAQDLHTQIAEALEGFAGGSAFVRAQELGFQHEQAGNVARAAEWYTQAGDEGLILYAYDRSLQLYQQAIALDSSGQQQSVARKLKYLNALFQAGKFQESLALGNELREVERISLPQRRAIVKTVGLAYLRLGEAEAAQTHLKDALLLSEDQNETVALKQELVGCEIAAGRFREAEVECRKQLASIQGLNNARLAGSIYIDLGIASFFQDRFDDAADCFGEALKQYEHVQEKAQITNAVNNIGNALSAKGDFVQAISYWERALKSSQEFGTLLQQAQIENNLGIAYFNLKKYQKAKECYQEAQSKYKRINSRIGLGYALTNLGEVQFAEGEYEAAFQRWSDARELYASMENMHGYVESCLHLADVLVRIGDTTSAQRQLEEAQRVIDARGLSTFLPQCTFLRGMVSLAERDCQSAEKWFAESTNLLPSAARDLRWLSILKLAEAHHANGKSEQSIASLVQVLESPDAKRYAPIIAEANYLLGVLAIAFPTAVKEKAIFYLKNGIDAIAKEPVGEITWKLTFALAREYHERGQFLRSREYLLKTKLVVQFFLSHFRSKELRDRYLATDQKHSVLATIEALTKGE